MCKATLARLNAYSEEGSTSQIVEVKVGRVGSKQGALCLSGSSGRLTGKDGMLPLNLTIPCICNADDNNGNEFHKLCWGQRAIIKPGHTFVGLGNVFKATANKLHDGQ